MVHLLDYFLFVDEMGVVACTLSKTPFSFIGALVPAVSFSGMFGNVFKSPSCRQY